MDAYTRKKGTRGLGSSTKGASITFKDPNLEDRQYCNRLGCSTRFNSLSDSQIGKPEKPKYPRSSFRSTCSKALAGNSSRPFSPSADLRKPHYEREGRISVHALSIGESNSRQEDFVELESSGGNEMQEDSESIPIPTSLQTMMPDPKDTTDKLSTGTTASSSRSRKPINQRASFGNHDTSSNSSFRHSAAQRTTAHTAKHVAHGLKNLSCTSASDVLPSSCSSSDFGRNKRVNTVRKRLSDGESSSSRGKGTNGSSNGGLSGSLPSGRSAPSLSLPEGSLPHQSSRRVRNQPASGDGAVSVRTRRPTGDTRTRLAVQQGDDDDLPIPEPTMIPQLSQSEISIPEAIPESSSRSFPGELPPVFRNSFGRAGSSNRNGRHRATSQHEGRGTQISHGPLADRGGYRRFYMEGIAEVLFALERIEHDEELTYERLLVLETNLFLDGLSFHDQHRDMRMDIDNMTYEELLALEEKMGTVSTALSEEALVKCLQRSIYMSASLVSGITGQEDDDTKCSICQEEYVVGDEVGKLACEHGFHIACIHQWLRLKNWCPICKASACSSS